VKQASGTVSPNALRRADGSRARLAKLVGLSAIPESRAGFHVVRRLPALPDVSKPRLSDLTSP
jgi:hypothetical protein